MNKQSNTCVFLRKKGEKKPKRETPALFAFESYLTGILTCLDSSGSWGRLRRVLDSCGSSGDRCLGATSGRSKPELVYSTLRTNCPVIVGSVLEGSRTSHVVGGVIICVYIIVVQ